MPLEEEVIGEARLIRGDCRELISALQPQAIVTDPPYGMNANTDSRRFTGGKVKRGKGKNWGPITGDNEEVDLSILPTNIERIVFGFNHFAAQLGRGACLVWIKQNPWSWGTFLSDAELAWKSTGCGVFCYQHTIKGTDYVNRGIPKYHPAEKPVAVMAWCIRKLTGAPHMICDPFMGSGSTGVAALALGRAFVGIEIETRWFDVACRRMEEILRCPILFDSESLAKPMQSEIIFDGEEPNRV